MAKEPKTAIAIPELDNEQGAFQLQLTTSKFSNGQIVSIAQGVFIKGGMLTFELCGDFRKVYARETGTATQKRLDTQHARAFDAAAVGAIKEEVRAFYAAKAQAKAG